MLDRMIDGTGRAARWLVIAIVLLLALQWPLRQLPGGWSRLANDTGQILFALYVAVALTAATRAGSHIAVDALARQYTPRTRDVLHRLASALVLAPWAAHLAWTATPMVSASAGQLEGFADTGNPGYFMVRAAVLLLAALMLAAGLADLVHGTPDTHASESRDDDGAGPR